MNLAVIHCVSLLVTTTQQKLLGMTLLSLPGGLIQFSCLLILGTSNNQWYGIVTQIIFKLISYEKQEQQ